MTWGNFLMGGYAQVGVGQSIASEDVPVSKAIVYDGWEEGLNSIGSLEARSAKSSLTTVTDMMVSRDNALVGLPAIVEIYDESPRALEWLFQQVSLDYTTELVAIDPPYLGYLNDVAFTWVNLGIATTGAIGWNATDVAGDLIFSNGIDRTYIRVSGAATVTDMSVEVVARTFATIFGRVFAGAYTDGSFQALGIRWNAANGSTQDWTSSGANAELLISDSEQADRIIALRPIGFDALGILCRGSLWMGYPNSDVDRPADFRLRIPGIGCVSERSAVVTPFGICFLSDEGVMLYDTNGVQNISHAINATLLPLDYTVARFYKAVYHPIHQQYRLTCPSGVTWIYEFPQAQQPGRWFMRTTPGVDAVVIFASQEENVTWDDMVGDWSAQTLSWAQQILPPDEAPPKVFYGVGSVLAGENALSNGFLDETIYPSWNTPEPSKDTITQAITTVGYELEYMLLDGNTATVRLSLFNANGTIVGATKVITLPAGTYTERFRRRIQAGFGNTGMGAQLRIEYLSGLPKVFRITQFVMDAGPGLLAPLAAV